MLRGFMNKEIEGYPGWHIEYNPKPIPYRGCDYDYWHDDHDGGDAGNGLCGTAASVEDAISEIIDIEDEL